MYTTYFYTKEQNAAIKQALLDQIPPPIFVRDHTDGWPQAKKSIMKKVHKEASKMNINLKQRGTVRTNLPNAYTDEELELIKTELATTTKRISLIGKECSVLFNRSLSGVMRKVYELNKNIVRPVREVPPRKSYYVSRPKKEKVKPVDAVKPVEPASIKLTLPEGMSFEGMAKRVEIHSNHFRVYF